MRNCKKNTRPMHYSLYKGEVPILDENGNEELETTQSYDNTVLFRASLSTGQSDAEESPFGKNVTYDRVISTCDTSLPIDENSLIWVKNKPVYNADGTDGTTTEYAYVTGTITASDVAEITISAETFPGTYYCTGDTYARSEDTGEDEFFQLVIPKAKVTSENTLTMEAEGDPSTFSMNLKVLRPADGNMMKLIKYSLTK